MHTELRKTGSYIVGWAFQALAVIILISCGSVRQVPFEKPVDTETVAVRQQEKKTWQYGSLSVTNQFDGARLNGFQQVNDSTFRATILPENTPINPSPWYAFRITEDRSRIRYFILDYGDFKHRYFPKLARNGSFVPVDSADVIPIDEHNVMVRCTLKNETVTLAAQPVITSRDVQKWILDLAETHDLNVQFYGESVEGRPLMALEVTSGKRAKPLVVLLCRQHPPEVTGWLALKSFLLEVLENNEVGEAFLDKYNILVFPMMNPDGVDHGFWRHNMGGVDLNRDWSEYEQPEIDQTVDYITRKSKQQPVVLALDFHSTYNDVFYTNDETLKPSTFPNFKEDWLARVKTYSPQFTFRESSSKPETPVSKNWFYRYFNATAITYEIGDDTPYDVINEKGRVTARAMMELLTKSNYLERIEN